MLRLGHGEGGVFNWCASLRSPGPVAEFGFGGLVLGQDLSRHRHPVCDQVQSQAMDRVDDLAGAQVRDGVDPGPQR
jgi:hypothetical protein